MIEWSPHVSPGPSHRTVRIVDVHNGTLTRALYSRIIADLSATISRGHIHNLDRWYYVR